MLGPCPVYSPANALPIAHRLLPGAKIAAARVGHHVWRKLHHVVHSVAAHPQLWLATGCRVVPAALAGIAFGVLPPASRATAPGDLSPPAAQTTQQSPQGGSAAIFGGGTGAGGGSLPSGPAGGDARTGTGPAKPTADLGAADLGTADLGTADLGSALITMMPPADFLSRHSATRSRDRRPTAGLYPTGAAFDTPVVNSPSATWPAQSVAEPSSLAVLVAALWGASMIKRRSAGRPAQASAHTGGTSENPR